MTVVMTASLILNDGIERPLDPGELTIGRDPDNDLVLITKTVSRQHARLVFNGGRWLLEDRGSVNGTLLNGHRIQPGAQLPLRHADRIELGSQTIIFNQPDQLADTDRTETAAALPVGASRALSPLQVQVVGCLCRAWLEGGTLEHLPSNEEIAAELGTPGAAGTVKAALRRAYAKAGVTDLPAHEKRRALCRIARQRGWI